MRIQFLAKGCVPLEQRGINLSYARTLAYPYVSERPRPPLAVVGGGHSLVSALPELRDWDGDIWACGSASPYCLREGLDATYFCIDPQASSAKCAKGAKRAIVATSIDPAMFVELEGADVEFFDLHTDGGDSNHGPTTATAAIELSVKMGYRDVTFFGCESSWDVQSHIYHHDNHPFEMLVKCDGKSFITCPEFLMQADFMAAVLRVAPMFKERSGGLLRALINDPDWDITHATQAFHDSLKQ